MAACSFSSSSASATIFFFSRRPSALSNCVNRALTFLWSAFRRETASVFTYATQHELGHQVASFLHGDGGQRYVAVSALALKNSPSSSKRGEPKYQPTRALDGTV